MSLFSSQFLPLGESRADHCVPRNGMPICPSAGTCPVCTSILLAYQCFFPMNDAITHPSIHPPIFLSINLCMHIAIYPLHLSIYLYSSIHPSICSSLHPSSIHPSIIHSSIHHPSIHPSSIPSSTWQLSIDPGPILGPRLLSTCDLLLSQASVNLGWAVGKGRK